MQLRAASCAMRRRAVISALLTSRAASWAMIQSSPLDSELVEMAHRGVPLTITPPPPQNCDLVYLVKYFGDFK